MSRKMFTLFAALIIAILALSACAPAQPAVVVNQTTNVTVSSAPAAAPAFREAGEPAPATAVVDPYACDSTTTSHCLTAGGKWTVPAGWNVSGDIKADGTSLYDNKAETGLVTHFTVTTEIEAPWGAFASADLSVDEMVAKLKESGCGSTCTTVNSVTYPKK